MGWKLVASVFLLSASMTSLPARGKEAHVTIIYDDRSSDIDADIRDAGQLWITTFNLKRATGFELKPQGVCRDELCFPVPKSRTREFVYETSGNVWFNLIAFAGLVQQPIAHDEALSTWYFGQRLDQRQSLTSLKAPDFTLPDMSGKIHALSDFRGKKVLLITWASW